MSPQILQYVDVATKVVQIIFWVIAGVVAVLTYRHARQTVLQPIRTEVFKAQLAAMSQIMGRFLGKNELELRDEFEFRRFFDVNAWALIDNYAMREEGWDTHISPSNAIETSLVPANRSEPGSGTPAEFRSPTIHPPRRATSGSVASHPNVAASRIPFSQR